MIKTQVCIIGAGAGGIGCAYSLLKNGIKTVIVDKNSDFGGTMVFSGVDGFEPGVSLDGLHMILSSELLKIGDAHIVEGVPNLNIFDPSVGDDWSKHSFTERPWGYAIARDELSYGDTMKRCISLRGKDGPMRRFQFEPDAMRETVRRVLSPNSENLTEIFGYTYKSCKTANGKVVSVTLSSKNGDTEVFADYFIDASGDIVFARDAGCEHTIGCDGRADFGEPSATERKNSVNAVSYVFRIGKVEDPEHIDTPPCHAEKAGADWVSKYMPGIVSCFVKYPNGDINVNMLPTMQGMEFLELGNEADEVGKARVIEYWRYLQTKKNMKGYTLKHIYDAGVRESYRLVGKYVLREQDLRRGKPDLENYRRIAIADHMMDVHGEGGIARELDEPYEIPLECTMTKEYDNLFVCCRGASFSHIAASSARLSRTILSMGEGVGEYIAEQFQNASFSEI